MNAPELPWGKALDRVNALNAKLEREKADIQEICDQFRNLYLDNANRVKELEKRHGELIEALKFYTNPAVYNADSVGRVMDITDVASNAIAKAGKQ